MSADGDPAHPLPQLVLHLLPNDIKVWDSIEHLHFLDQARWSSLISLCHGSWGTCLKSSSQQNSLRRSSGIVCGSCRGVDQFMKRESNGSDETRSLVWDSLRILKEFGSVSGLICIHAAVCCKYDINIQSSGPGLRFAFWKSSVLFLVQFISMLLSVSMTSISRARVQGYASHTLIKFSSVSGSICIHAAVYAVSIWYQYPGPGLRFAFLIKFDSVSGSICVYP